MKYEVYDIITNKVILGGFLTITAAKKFGFWNCPEILWAVREEKSA